MRIVEQSFIATERMVDVQTAYPAKTLFQVFVKELFQKNSGFLSCHLCSLQDLPKFVLDKPQVLPLQKVEYGQVPIH